MIWTGKFPVKKDLETLRKRVPSLFHVSEFEMSQNIKN